MALPYPFSLARKRARQFVRSLGWDVVRYRPMWSTLLGVEALPVRTVLDVGAHRGDTAGIFCRLFPQATLYCFEPQDGPYRALAAWSSAQQGRVHALPYALGNHNGSSEFNVYPKIDVCSSVLRTDPAWRATRPQLAECIVTTIPIRRLDDAVTDLAMQDAILIKIDTEGSERDVIAGGSDTLQRAVACIVEVNTTPRFVGQPTLRELWDLMASLGLEYAGNVLQQREAGIGITYLDALFLNRRLIGSTTQRG